MTCDPNWTTYVAALLTPVVAVLAAVIAYRQWRLAQNKLKFDLLDRRLLIYEGAGTFLLSVYKNRKATDEEVFDFRVAMRESKWLLDDSLAEYLKQLHSKATELLILADEIEGERDDEVRVKNTKKQLAIQEWFLKQFEVLDEKFTPFLKLRH